jgi:hypothetical protein
MTHDTLSLNAMLVSKLWTNLLHPQSKQILDCTTRTPNDQQLQEENNSIKLGISYLHAIAQSVYAIFNPTQP